MKKITQIAFCGLMVLLLTGCNKTAKLDNGNDYLVSFNNSEYNITVDDLFKVLKEEHGISYLVEMIDEKILNSLYERDDVAEKYLENMIETYSTYYGGKDKLLETLQQSGYKDLNDFTDNLFLNYQRQLALKDYVRKEITEKDIEKYYNDKIFGDITASHILIPLNVTSSSTEEEKRTAEEEADKTIKEILDKLKDNGDFYELAKEYSKDTSNSANGGRLEPFNKGEMDESFEEAAVKLEVGKYTTAPVKSAYGYHLIYKESQKEKPKLEDVKETIIKSLIDEKIASDSKLQYKALIELRKEYGISFNDDTLNSSYENAVNNWLYSK